VIPYYPEPDFRIGPIELHAFGLMLVAAVLLGGYIMVKRACVLKMSGHLMFSVSQWAIACGLIGADLAKFAMDYTPVIRAHPSIVFTTSFGIRSIGGVAGGLMGALICCRLRRVSWFETFRMLDIMAFAMPFAFMVGRLGCALVHDHPGIPSTSWIAVQFPDGPRYDLGLVEFLFLIPMSALFYLLDRKPRPAGFFLALYGVLYGGLRIWLDTLHIQPMRFYEGIALCCLGLTAWVLMWRDSESRDPAPHFESGKGDRRSSVPTLTE
jgi:phosphatidylglycerol:prolipoprotein diacylglycerol transferase